MLTIGLLGKRTALKWTVCGAVPQVPYPVCSAWICNTPVTVSFL